MQAEHMDGAVDLFGAANTGHDHGCKSLLRIPSSWKVTAEFGGSNDCYRYKLMHQWGPGPLAMIAMKNPSGAGITVGDMTVMKTAKIFQRLGFGGQYIANTCAYRHVNPKALLEVEDPVGPRNHAAILEMAVQCSMIVVAHGQLPGQLQGYAAAMCRMLLDAGHRLHVLRLSQSGVPMHPLVRGKLMIPVSTDPVPWQGPPGDPDA